MKQFGLIKKAKGDFVNDSVWNRYFSFSIKIILVLRDTTLFCHLVLRDMVAHGIFTNTD